VAVTNPFVVVVEMCGGVEKIEDLQRHEDNNICDKAVKILRTPTKKAERERFKEIAKLLKDFERKTARDKPEKVRVRDITRRWGSQKFGMR
jgi:predicted metal-dependent hydrolase